MGFFEDRRKRNELRSLRLDAELKEYERMEAESNAAIETAKMIENYYASMDDDTGWTLHGSVSGQSAEKPTYGDVVDYQKSAYDMYRSNPHARAIIRSFEKFVIGRGALIDHHSEDDSVREYWKRFIKENNWHDKSREIFRRLVRDGEVFIVKKKVREKGNSTIRLRFIEPFEIAPDDDGKPSYGIKTSPKDVEDVKWYQRRYRKGDQIQTDRIYAKDMWHFKINCDSTDKRGVPILEPVMSYITKYEQWINDRIVLNKVRTAIALVKKYTATPEQLSVFRTENKGSAQTSQQDKKQKMIEPGTIVHTTQGVDYEFLSPNIDAKDVAEDGRAILLTISAGAGLPEFIVTGDACHDETTEVLTQGGWITYDKITPDTLVATMNQETHKLEYQRPIRMFLDNYDGEMIYIKSKHNFDMMVTPNHRMMVTTHQYRRSGGGLGKLYKDGIKPWRAIEAGKLELTKYLVPSNTTGYVSKCPETFTIPSVDRSHLNPSEPITVDMKAWLEFLGWFVSEGWINSDGPKYHYTIGMSQKLGPHADRIRELLKEIPFNWVEYDDTKDVVQFRANNKALWTWLAENVGIGALNKRVPEFIKTLDSEYIDIFLQAAIDGDGSRKANGSAYYYTISRELADDMLQLSIMSGYISGCGNEMENGVIPIKFRKGREYVQLEPKKHISRVDYRGKVWCVEVSNGTVITRRGCCVAISYNSNANYSSSLVAESPGVREIEDYQSLCGSIFQLIYADLMVFGSEMGEVKEEKDNSHLEAEFNFPSIIHRDFYKENQAYQIQKENHVISVKTWREKMDYDSENEDANIELERDRGYWVEHDEPNAEPKGGDNE